MKIVIPGGSGQVGQILARHFHQKGHEVTVLSRTPKTVPWRVIKWDGATLGAWLDTIEGSDVLINLAGRSVNCRYNRENRRAILESRVRSTQILNEAVSSLRRPPAVWLNASTATIYRHSLDRPMDETTGELGGGEPGAPDTWNFSIRVATAWERTFFSTTTRGTRKVAMRSAMILSANKGGVFDMLLGLVRHGLGGAISPGTQFVSWFHEHDFARSVEFLIRQQELSGVFNLASPNPLPNRTFLQVLRQEWGVAIGLPTAAWALEFGTFLLRTESELVLKSRRVVPGRLQDAGFCFAYPEWTEAARDLVARWKERYS
jgi:hypothetical protein